MPKNNDSDFVITEEEKLALEEELKRLDEVERTRVSEKIKEAVKLGDISENQQYSEAKEEMQILESRIAEIREKLSIAKVVKSLGKKDGIRLHSRVTIVFNDTGEEDTFTLVGSTEVDPIAKKYSVASSLGKAILGRKVGDEVEYESPRGKKRITIKKIEN